MKNMVLLIDTNVILDDLLFRFPQYENSFRVMSSCLKDEIKEGRGIILTNAELERMINE